MTTILFGGGEDTSFTFVGTPGQVAPTTNSSYFRSTWAREAIIVSTGSTTDPPSPLFFTPTFTVNISPNGGQYLWLHGQTAWISALGGSNTLNSTMFRLLDAGTARIVVRGTGVGGELKVDKRDSGGVFTNLFTTIAGAFPNGGLQPYVIDLQVVYGSAAINTYGPATDISFAPAGVGTAAVISSVSTSFNSGGNALVSGDIITVSGSNLNDGTYQVETVGANSLTLLNGSRLAIESAGATVTIVKPGCVRLYIDDIFAGMFVGDVTTDGASSLNSADFACPTTTTSGMAWSEIVIADTITINKALQTLLPTTPGTTQTWSGAASDINEATINDVTYISQGANSALSGWTTGSLPAGFWVVDAVIQEARVARGIIGPQHFAWYIHTASSDFTTGTLAPSTAFTNFSNQIWATNPSDGPWVQADITGIELGIESLA